MNPNAYRVFDLQEKRWLGDSEVCQFPDGSLYKVRVTYGPTDGPLTNFQASLLLLSNKKRFVICRYTGRDDKDGEPIFEHDRLGDGERFEGVVVWDNKVSAWRVSESGEFVWFLTENFKRLGSTLEGE